MSVRLRLTATGTILLAVPSRGSDPRDLDSPSQNGNNFDGRKQRRSFSITLCTVLLRRNLNGC